MQTLIKRFELIKSCILLGDEELIPNQLAKLPASDDARVLAIVAALGCLTTAWRIAYSRGGI